METPPLADPDGVYKTLRTCARTPDLDERARRDPAWARAFEAQITRQSERAWATTRDVDEEAAALRLDLQRALYEINRLRFYWGDSPSAYANERSQVLIAWQALLEEPWQRWLAEQVKREPWREPHRDAREQLYAWAERDLNPLVSEDERWLAEHMNAAGYRRLLQIVSLNALVEASQLSRAVAGAASPVQAMLFRILMEEYGAGRLEKKHSTFFAHMLERQGMRATPEAYLEAVPWEVLSVINHAFNLSENKRHYLRFCGAFTYTELSTPVSYRGYARAAARLGFSNGHDDYWALHIREDARHGPWMLEQVAIPLLAQFPEQQEEVLFGYAQQRLVERTAGAAVVRACRAAAEREAS